MKELFVTYEQALALKDLGFDEDCLGRWLAITEWEKPTGEIKLQLGVKVEDYDKNQCLAPLKSQVFKWFRKNSSINGIVSYYGKDQWNIEILDYKGNELIQIEDNTFWSYEEAESACIDKLIELVKQGK